VTKIYGVNPLSHPVIPFSGIIFHKTTIWLLKAKTKKKVVAAAAAMINPNSIAAIAPLVSTG
jgi:hypothetical protein